MWERRNVSAVALALVLAAGTAACGDDDDDSAVTTDAATAAVEPATSTSTSGPEPAPTTSTNAGPSPTTAAESESAATTTSPPAVSESDRISIRDVLDASVAAEAAGDAGAFVALWTDRGLEQYSADGSGLGTREEILANGIEGAEEPPEPVGDPVVTVAGDDASVTVDVAFGIGVYRIGFALVRDGDSWLIDGFEFQGGAPAPQGVPMVEVTAVDFAFGFDRDALASGEFALLFDNIGSQQHEMALFRVPDEATVADAGAALAGVDGGSYEGVPAGYEAVDHLAFAEPGEEHRFHVRRAVASRALRVRVLHTRRRVRPRGRRALGPRRRTAHSPGHDCRLQSRLMVDPGLVLRSRSSR